MPSPLARRLLAAVATACSALAVVSAPRPAAAQTRPAASVIANTAVSTTDTVWFITNRARSDNEFTGTLGDRSAGFRAFRLSPLRTDEVSFELRLDISALEDTVLSSDTVMHALDTRVRSGGDRGVLLVHVHGYATSWDRATREAVEMKQRGGYEGPMLIFAWPAHSTAITWPTSSQFVSRAYWDDAAAASGSVPTFVRTLSELVSRIGASRIVLSAHSMGNQLIAQALADSGLSAQLRRTPLRAIVFASTDLDLAAFRDTIIPHVRQLADNLVMYGARDDLMLRLSQAVHDGRPRAGRLDDSVTWPDALHVVDVTDGRSAAWWLGPLFDSNHAFRRDGTAMVDLFQVVLRGAPANCRETLGIAERDSAGTWHLTDAPLPARPWMSAVQREDAAPLTPCTASIAAP